MDEAALVQALQRGDEEAFAGLVERYGRLMSRVAFGYVGSAALAEDVVQETWLAVVEGIERFEGRSSLKTWLLSIVANRARTRHGREARSVPLSADSLTSPHADPEAAALTREALGVASAAVRALPRRQRDVI